MMIRRITPRTAGLQHGARHRLHAHGLHSTTEEQASQMTSFSANASTSATPQLFNIPARPDAARAGGHDCSQATLKHTLRLTGAVAYNAFNTTPVITQVGGPVSRILVVPGQHVKAGQPMLDVSSPDYSQLLDSYLKAADSFRLADKFYVRAQDLYQHHAIAERDLEQAESDRTQAQADLNAAEQGMKILGIKNPADLAKAPSSALIPVLAPISGEVVERLVSPGQVVQAGQTQAFTISDLSTVWVLANVYQADLAYVRNGDDVVVETDAYPDSFHGRISYVSPALDPNTRTLQARIVVDNPGEKLKSDMYCTVTVTAGVLSNALAVPNASVLRDDNNQPFVYVANGRKSVWQARCGAGRKPGWPDANSKGPFRWRQGCRRRQPVSSVCQFAATLRRQASHDSSHRSVCFAATVAGPAAGGIHCVGGAISFQHMPVDAYPDLSPPMVEVITQWPGHAAEEIERLVTVPTEVEMNGVPKMSVMRSISLYGLSDVIMTFDEGTDDYFAREVVFQRLSEVTYPTGVTPTLAPLASPSGLVYRYVLESPDRTPQELKTYEDWVVEREYKQVPGVADDSGFGGTVMQYQVLLDPARALRVPPHGAHCDAAALRQ